MSSGKATPGPWEFNGDFGEIQTNLGAITIAYCDDEANGRLIAAAPELLDALEYILDVGELVWSEADDAMVFSIHLANSTRDEFLALSMKARGAQP